MKVRLIKDRRYFKKDYKKGGSILFKPGQVISKDDIVDLQVTGKINGNSIVSFEYNGHEFYFLGDEIKDNYYFVS